MKVKPAESGTGPQRYRFTCPGCGMLPATFGWPGGKPFVTHHFDASWQYNGDGERPHVSPSILVTGGGNPQYRCHSFIEHGRIRFLSDCSHPLAGQTVDLPEIE